MGEVEGGPAQRAIRKLFVEHVIGRGRFSSAAPIARAIRMPTPVAVLQAAKTLAGLDAPALLRRPVVVDVGGATTDVHSVIPVDPGERAYVTDGLPEERVSRTVEGDLGMRENAISLVEAARRDGFRSRPWTTSVRRRSDARPSGTSCPATPTSGRSTPAWRAWPRRSPSVATRALCGPS